MKNTTMVGSIPRGSREAIAGLDKESEMESKKEIGWWLGKRPGNGTKSCGKTCRRREMTGTGKRGGGENCKSVGQNIYPWTYLGGS